MKIKISLLRWSLLLLSIILIFFGGLLLIQILTSKHIKFPYVIGTFTVSIIFTIFSSLRIIYLLNKLLNRMQLSIIFSQCTLETVKKIKDTILITSIIFTGVLPFFYRIATMEDAPGVMLLGIGITFIPFSVYLFSEIVMELFKNAINIKKDNDLTI